MASELRGRVVHDAKRISEDMEQVRLGVIQYTDGSKDAVSVMDLNTFEPSDRAYKMIHTGVDMIPTPAQHWALILSPGRVPRNGAALVMDKNWRAPNIFTRPETPLGR